MDRSLCPLMARSWDHRLLFQTDLSLAATKDSSSRVRKTGNVNQMERGVEVNHFVQVAVELCPGQVYVAGEVADDFQTF